METMTVTEFAEALSLVGQVYRNRDGSKPADAVQKLLSQLGGAGHLTLAEWVEGKRNAPNAKAPKAKEPKASGTGNGGKAKGAPKPPEKRAQSITADQAMARLEQAETHAALREAITGIELSAHAWKRLASTLTGKSERTRQAARDVIETHFSDLLLIDERVRSVRRQFG